MIYGLVGIMILCFWVINWIDNMKTKKIEVKTIKTIAICENCNQGEMLYYPEPINSLILIPNFRHKCSSCAYVKCLDDYYPKISYEEI